MTRNRKQRGFALMLYAIMLTFIVAAGGLALDVGSIYMIRARLAAATDAAALAAGRSVNLADTVSAATTAATTVAEQFFTANFPTGYFNTEGTPTVTPAFNQETDVNGNPTGVLDVTVSASVKAPTYFMNIFHVSSVNVGANSTASRRGVVMMIVLDQSSSMNTPTTPTACASMIQATQNFITLFSPFDTIGLVTFDLTVHLPYPPSSSWGDGTLNTDIGNIVCQSNTNTIGALELAYQEIKAVNLPLAENTIVLFTDGSPNGVTAYFPVRVNGSSGKGDTRWGPAGPTSAGFPAPPSQPGSVSGYNGATPSCGGTTAANTGAQDANGVYDESPCYQMPTMSCTSGDTVLGALGQWGDQNSYGGTTYGFAQPSDYSGVSPAALYNTPSFSSSVCATAASQAIGTYIRQYIAYIPNSDVYGNVLNNGPAASGTSSYGTIVGGYDTRSEWLFQVNSLCSPDSTVSPNCKNTGGPWSGFSTTGTGSNFFPAGTQYAGYLRPDQPNSIVAASMNGTMNAANTIRSDTTFHPTINVIYLTGNGTDSVDREFLPIVANYPTIPALPYDPTSYTAYTNPAYQTDQETGKYFVTADKTQLTSLFAQLASEVLRLSK
ncbi:MAG TPA: vWA domain-containing protein [Bryobacteraceae bacterium]|nr:vWA domain-containing protein [Bryobacteraceae bacterium]